jgi:hypothetical protein
MSGLARKSHLAAGSSRKASPASWLLQGSGAGRERWEIAAFVGASLLAIQTAGLVGVAAMSGTARRPRKASPASWLLHGSGAGRERWEVAAFVGASVLAIQTAGLVSGAAMSGTARRPRKASPASWLLHGSDAGCERWEASAFVGASLLAIQTAGLGSGAAMSGTARRPRKASPASRLLHGSDAGLMCREASAFVGASVLAIQTAGLVSGAAMSRTARRPRKASPASWLLHGSDAGLKCREASAFVGASLLAIQTASLVSVAAMSGTARRPRKASPASWLLHGSDGGLNCREASAFVGASVLAIQTAGLVSVAAMSGIARRPRKASPASWLLHGSDAVLNCRQASVLGGARDTEPLLANQAHRPDFSPFPMLRGYP